MCKVFALGFTLDYERDWSSPVEQWKLTFSRDVLPCIEKGIVDVGFDEDDYCANCYFYRCNSICEHDYYEEIDWNKFDDVPSWILKLAPSIDVMSFRKITGHTMEAHLVNRAKMLEIISWNNNCEITYLHSRFGLSLVKNS